MKWEEELKILLKDGCTDTDIEDFICDHPDISDNEI